MLMPTQGVYAAMGSCAAVDGESRRRRWWLAGGDRLPSEVTETAQRGSRRRRCGARDLALTDGEMELWGFDSAEGTAVDSRARGG